MSTFIVIDMYINLMNLLFTVLDDTAPLEIFDPASSAGDLEPGIIDVQCTAQTTLNASLLDNHMTTVHQKLKEALFDRYFNWYHPIKALQNPNEFYHVRTGGHKKAVAAKEDFHYSYLIDIQSMFHPALCSGKLLEKVIFSINDVTQEKQQCHYELVTNHIWLTISCLAEQVAFAHQH